MRVIFEDEGEARDVMESLLEQFPAIAVSSLAAFPKLLGQAALCVCEGDDGPMAHFYAAIIAALATEDWVPPDNHRMAPSRADALRLFDAVSWLRPDPEESDGAGLRDRTRALVEHYATGMPRTEKPPRASIDEQLFNAQQKALAHRKDRAATPIEKDTP